MIKLRWAQADMDTLTDLWAEGFSASEIAKRLDNKFTRNAVIGKVHRLRLPTHKAPVGEHRAAIPQKLYKPSAYKPTPALLERERLRMQRKRAALDKPARIVKPPPPPPPEPWDGPSISILDDGLRQFMCREIVAGSGVHTMFCGAPTAPGSQFSYCQFHAQKNLRVVKRHDDAKPRFVPYRVAA